jgi:hypothetical protein
VATHEHDCSGVGGEALEIEVIDDLVTIVAPRRRVQDDALARPIPSAARGIRHACDERVIAGIASTHGAPEEGIGLSEDLSRRGSARAGHPSVDPRG